MSAELVALLLLGAAGTSVPDPLDRVLNGPAEPAAIFQARGALEGCAEPTCRAVNGLARAFKVATKRDLPNTMAQLRPSQGDPEPQADRALERLLPARGTPPAAYCRVLTKLAGHYSAWSVGLLTIEFANRLDRGGEACTRKVIAAFPATKDAGDMIVASRDACMAARRGGCERDRRSPGAA